MNFVNDLWVVAPVMIGYIAGATKSFTGAFLAARAALIVGIVAYVFLLVRLDSDRRSAGPPDRLMSPWL